MSTITFETMRCLGMPGTFRPHCSHSCRQSCMYADKTHGIRSGKYLLRTISETLNFKMSLDASALKNLCLWCEFRSCLLFIISLLLKNFLTALVVGSFSATLVSQQLALSDMPRCICRIFCFAFQRFPWSSLLLDPLYVLGCLYKINTIRDCWFLDSCEEQRALLLI